MINVFLIIIPLIGVIVISLNLFNNYDARIIGLIVSIITFFLSLTIYILFDYSNIEYQYIQEIYQLKGLNINLGVDGISIYFLILTTFITPIVILSN
jgi:NADH-ubiquinone oxidoreductase chain 4